MSSVRVRFFRPTDEAETGAHLALERRVDAFWKVVASDIAASVARGRAHDPETTRRLGQAARAVDDRLLAELVDEPDGATVVVSHTGQPAAGALADAAVERAPVLHGLRAARHRSPRPLARVIDEVRERHGVDFTYARARAGFSRGHLLEVVIRAPGVQDGADPRALDGANLAVMSLLGEERFDDWIGSVDVAPMPRSSSLRVVHTDPEEAGRFPIGDLVEAVDVAITGLTANLGSAPYHTYCERADWTLLEVEPDARARPIAQDDLVQCATMLPEMTKCFLAGMRFSSRRFSAHGERFAYLKVDAGRLTMQERHDLQLTLEDALNYALVPGRIGCVVAAGVGLRYVYLTLALENLDAGVELATRTARKGGAPEAAWLLFCDSAWADEWVGVHDTSPRPPGI